MMSLQNTSLPYVCERCRPMGLFHTYEQLTTVICFSAFGALIPIPDVGDGASHAIFC